MNIQFTLALRYLNGRKLRTFLTTLAVVFGVLVLFSMNSILPSMLHAMTANEMAMAGQVDVTVSNITGEPFEASIFDKVKSLDGVSSAAASFSRTINLPANLYTQTAKAGQLTALDLVGIDPGTAQAVRAYPLLAGRFLSAGDTTSTVITQSLADTLGLQIGGTFSIPTTKGIQELTVVGILPARAAPGNEQVLVSLPEAQSIFNQPSMVNKIDLNLNSTDPTRRSQIIAAIETVLGANYTVGTLSSTSDFATTIQMAEQLFTLFGILALFMGAFIIFNTFRTIVAERRRDIGMLRAIGADRKTITWLFLIEGLLQGTIGTVAGLIFGYLFAAGILKLASPLLSQFVNIQLGSPVISPTIIVVSILLGVGMTVLAGLIPARNASKVTPLEALRPSTADVEFKRQTGRGFIVGLVLAIASLIALFSKQLTWVAPGALLFLVSLVLIAPALVRPIAYGLGWIIARFFARSNTGELAKENLARQPSRVAITASATMLGLAVIVAIGGTISSLTVTMSDLLKKTLGSDYLIMPPSVTLWNTDLGSSADFANRLRSIDGVETVSTMRFANAVANGQTVSLLGINPQAFQKVSGLSFLANAYPNETGAYQAISDSRAIIGNGAFLATMQVKVGDTIEVSTPNGAQSYRIAAEATDILDAKISTAFISQANLATDFGKTEDVFIQLDLKPGANAAAVDQAIRSTAADYPQFTVIDGKSYSDTLAAEFNVAFAALYFLLAILALPSLIAMLNTLAIGIIERTREIGMLRAIGSSQRQVRRMVLAEALILAGIGTSFGVAAGLYLGYLFVLGFGAIFPLGYAFPGIGIAVALVVGLGFGVFAAIIPARQAARMEIVQALRYE